MASSTGGKGNKKADRQKKSAQNLRYINEGRQNKGHLRRITKHLKAFPADTVAVEAQSAYRIKVKGR